jgi:signal transduction histidine kinase
MTKESRMPDSAPTNRQDLTPKLASARQSLALLRSQLKSGDAEAGYWVDRLDEMADLLKDLSDERTVESVHPRLAVLYEVSTALGSTLDLVKVLNQVMDAIVELAGAERGFLMLFEDGDKLAVRVARNVEKETLDDDEFAISRSVIELVASEGQGIVTTNAAQDPRFSAQVSVVTHNLRSILCVPLQTRGHIMGVIYVDNRVRTAAFQDDDLELLTAFATQAAMAIENARLFTLTDEALARRVEELSLLQEIDRQLNETLDFSKVMALTLDWAVKLSHAQNGAIALIDLDEGTTRIVAQVGETPAGVRDILTGAKNVNEGGSLAVPVQREGRVIGVIALDRQTGQPFDREVQAFVHRLADHAAISIENTRLYDDVRQANEAKNEFVSVMTHELRVPMTSIKGYAEMIGMVGSLTEQQGNFLEIIRNNVERMSVQVSDLSDITRIESGRLNIEIEDGVEFDPILQDAMRALQAEIDKRGHTLTVVSPADLPALYVDPQRLTQILINLLSNAYKYTLDGGQISVRLSHADSFVHCQVSDTGVGMTEEELGHLWSKFWRSEDRFVREQPGTGLGLTIARSLVEMQGGKLTVTSQKGAGTTFEFTIPVSG